MILHTTFYVCLLNFLHMCLLDLVPREAVEKWLKYLREEFPTVAFKCSTHEQRANLGWKSFKAVKSNNLLQTNDCLGAETLIKLLKNYSRSREKSITVGIVGLPIVGKSSLINSLKRSHVVNVGATPGLTRSMQEVHLDKNYVTGIAHPPGIRDPKFTL
ncbi:Guanine nucleotide-binding protein-like nsn1 [Dionaea muscipula]